jgi:hypothetical protein
VFLGGTLDSSAFSANGPSVATEETGLRTKHTKILRRLRFPLWDPAVCLSTGRSQPNM